MTYEVLKDYMYLWRIGQITKRELACAIHVWQRGLNEKAN